MAYCKSCGAYIPEDQTRCLACGKTEEEIKREAKMSAGAASARAYSYSDYSEKKSGEYHYVSEKMKDELEKQRQRQQEYDRKWADAEKARREQENARRQSEAQQRSASGTSRQHSSTSDGVTGTTSPETARIFAALSYLWIGCFIPMILFRDNDFAMYHARQGLRLLIVGAILSLAASIIGLRWLVSLGWFFLIYRGMKNALAGRKEPLPYIGK